MMHKCLRKSLFFLLGFLIIYPLRSEESTSVKNNNSEMSWPRTVVSDSGAKIQIYTPQAEEWENQQKLTAWSAVELLKSGSSKSEMGVVKWEGQTSVSLEERLVKFTSIQLKQVNFPTLNQASAREVVNELNDLFPKEGLVMELDRLLAAIDKSSIRAQNIKINTEPPPIFYSKKPAMLIQFDGEPIISPIKDSSLKFIVNTNWDVFQDPDENKYYLRHEKFWYVSDSIEKGWKPITKLPKSFKTIPDEPNWSEVRKNIPPRGSKKPMFFVSKKPAELIVTRGNPKKVRVEKSKLYWISNTECDLFQMKKGAYYFLVSGRWFKADKLEGPWTFATPELPKEFLDIPVTHERSRVRAAIPGTDEAAEAVLIAQIPQTLRLTRAETQGVKVHYQGEPQFKEIEGTKASYAVNSANDVLKYGDMYYLCFQGAWFESRNANGPWELATSVPEDFYKIPADCPVHHVTYVRVANSNPTEVEYVYTSGYSGVSVSFGVAMYGTGWYYPPYYYYGGYYPVYYPYHSSYGSYAVYNHRTGAYGIGSSVSGPYGGISHTATYNPNTGTYARKTASYGPGGSQMHAQAYNPRTGTAFETNQNRNSQGSWGSSTVKRGDDWAKSGHIKTDQGKISGIKTSDDSGMIRASGSEGSGFVGKHGDDIYAGKDGNVYRKTDSGWQQHTENGWTDVDGARPTPSTRDQAGASTRDLGASTKQGSINTRDQLNRDASYRSGGNQRIEQRSSTRTNASTRGSYQGSGSYRGGGGGSFRGGGGGGRRR